MTVVDCRLCGVNFTVEFSNFQKSTRYISSLLPFLDRGSAVKTLIAPTQYRQATQAIIIRRHLGFPWSPSSTR